MLNTERQINRLRNLRGFTIAEILIAMIVLGLLGALTVPMLGQQKDKTRLLKHNKNHGTVECYYDTDGNLHQFQSDNKENKEGTDTIVAGDACYFTMPNVNVVIVEAIGAGGDGGYPASGGPHYIYDDSLSITGKISVDENFRADIESEETPEWVRKEWNDQWKDPTKFVEYYIYSALGGGGYDVCEPRAVNIDETTCAPCAIGTAYNNYSICPQECSNVVMANGGNGANGVRVLVKAKLYYDPNGLKDNVEFINPLSEDNGLDFGFNPDEAEVTLKFNNSRYVVVQPTAKGKSAFVDTSGVGKGRHSSTARDLDFDGIPWVAGENYNSSSRKPKNLQIAGDDITLAGVETTDLFKQGKIACKYDSSYHYFTPGRIEARSPEIEYVTSSPAIKGWFGLAGEPGKAIKLSFETIPAGTEFKLTPARDNNGPSKVEVRKNEPSFETLFVANSGANGRVIEGNESLAISGQQDFPFPKVYYPASFERKLSNLSISGGADYKSRLTELLINPSFTPGTSGYGSYPLVNNVNSSAVHTINGVATGGDSSALNTENEVNECIDGSMPIGASGNQYCISKDSDAKKGKPGVVAISW